MDAIIEISAQDLTLGIANPRMPTLIMIQRRKPRRAGSVCSGSSMAEFLSLAGEERISISCILLFVNPARIYIDSIWVLSYAVKFYPAQQEVSC